MNTFRVRSAAGTYEVLCGKALLGRAGRYVARMPDSTGAFVLSSPRVWRLWGRALAKGFKQLRRERVILFDDRESSKRLTAVEGICRRLARAGADRGSVLVAMGGGVVGDVAGFVAASYLRGVRLVHIPTTLVAQADSAIGGKTGVNLPEGKNLVGAFYPPCLVLSDPEVLRTLPERQYRSGLYEVVKYGIILDSELFDFLEKRLGSVLRRETGAISFLVPRCARTKARVVERDEKESGLRQILNFGHTIGHALEAATGYRRFLHGEAVGFGMAGAALLAVAMNRLKERDAARIIRIIAALGPIPPAESAARSRLLSLVRADKKSRRGRVGWVLPRGIGRVETGVDVPDGLVKEVIALLPGILARGEGFWRL